MYRLDTLDTCNLFAFFIVDDVSPWVLASEGRLAAKRSNGKVHVACGRACPGGHPMYLDYMECGGMTGWKTSKDLQ